MVRTSGPEGNRADGSTTAPTNGTWTDTVEKRKRVDYRATLPPGRTGSRVDKVHQKDGKVEKGKTGLDASSTPQVVKNLATWTLNSTLKPSASVKKTWTSDYPATGNPTSTVEVIQASSDYRRTDPQVTTSTPI